MHRLKKVLWNLCGWGTGKISIYSQTVQQPHFTVCRVHMNKKLYEQRIHISIGMYESFTLQSYQMIVIKTAVGCSIQTNVLMCRCKHSARHSRCQGETANTTLSWVSSYCEKKLSTTLSSVNEESNKTLSSKDQTTNTTLSWLDIENQHHNFIDRRKTTFQFLGTDN